MAWTLLNPLLQMAVYTLVFSVVVRIQLPAYPVYLLSGLLPWTLVSVGTTTSCYALLSNQSLIRKVAVPQAVYPLAVVGGKLVDLLFSLAPLALVASLLGRPPGASWLFLPVAITFVTAFTTGLALLASSLTVFFRDIRHLVEILFQVWFYLTPIIYPPALVESLPQRAFRALFAANPATPLVRCFQATLYEGRLPSAGTVAAAGACAAAALLVGLWAFARAEDRHVHWF
jgi:ABC-type polysaccharide/polyol phosphate export permease